MAALFVLSLFPVASAAALNNQVRYVIVFS
jgi:hypothetical protein